MGKFAVLNWGRRQICFFVYGVTARPKKNPNRARASGQEKKERRAELLKRRKNEEEEEEEEEEGYG